MTTLVTTQEAVALLTAAAGDNPAGGTFNGDAAADLIYDLVGEVRDVRLLYLAIQLSVVGVMLVDQLAVEQKVTPQEILHRFGQDLAEAIETTR